MVSNLKKGKEQLRVAEQLLWEQHVRELSALTPAQANAASQAVLVLALRFPLPLHRHHSSGLVEQQRYFQRART